MVNDMLYVLALRVQVGLEAWPLCINGWLEQPSHGGSTSVVTLLLSQTVRILPTRWLRYVRVT